MLGAGRRADMYAGDWIFNLLGTTMWVGGLLSLGGAGAILLALLNAAMGAGGLAGARGIPPSGVVLHAEEVRARMRSRYMARAWRASEAFARPAFDPGVGEEEADAARPFSVPEPTTEPIAVLIARGGEMSITRLPPLNESLRRRLATRVAERPTPPPAKPPRKARRKAKRTRRPVRA
jgi:hypothetical protein